MPLSLDHSLTIAADVMFQRLNDEAVLLDLKSGTYFGLNDVGARMWQLIEEEATLSRIVEALEQEYRVDRADLERDVLRLADELIARRLVQLAEVGDDGVAGG